MKPRPLELYSSLHFNHVNSCQYKFQVRSRDNKDCLIRKSWPVLIKLPPVAVIVYLFAVASCFVKTKPYFFGLGRKLSKTVSDPSLLQGNGMLTVICDVCCLKFFLTCKCVSIQSTSPVHPINKCPIMCGLA